MAATATALKILDRLLWRLWGNQTRAQATQEETIEEAEFAFREALRLGDHAGANTALDRLWQLRDKAAARAK